MLVLSRGVSESIMVGQDIEIVVIDIRGDKVRLGISAPQTCPVHRREVYDAINRKEGLEGVPTVIGKPAKYPRTTQVETVADCMGYETPTPAKRLTLRDVLAARARAAKQKPNDPTP